MWHLFAWINQTHLPTWSAWITGRLIWLHYSFLEEACCGTAVIEDGINMIRNISKVERAILLLHADFLDYWCGKTWFLVLSASVKREDVTANPLLLLIGTPWRTHLPALQKKPVRDDRPASAYPCIHPWVVSNLAKDVCVQHCEIVNKSDKTHDTRSDKRSDRLMDRGV